MHRRRMCVALTPSRITASGGGLLGAVIHGAIPVPVGTRPASPFPPRPERRRDRALDAVLHVVEGGHRPAGPFYGLRRDRPLDRSARMGGTTYAARDQKPAEKSHLTTPLDPFGERMVGRLIRADKITTRCPPRSAHRVTSAAGVTTPVNHVAAVVVDRRRSPSLFQTYQPRP